MTMLRRLTLATTDMYVIGIAAIVIGSPLTRDQFWPFAMGINVLPWLLIPSVMVFITALALRDGFRIGASSIPIMVFALLFGGQFMPRPTLHAAGGQDLRILTFNTLGREMDPHELAAIIRAQDADIVALQELHTTSAEVLIAELHYPYMTLYPDDTSGVPGVGLLSRYPISAESLVYTGGFIQHMEATVTIKSTDVHVMNVHPRPPGRTPSLQFYDASGRTHDVNALVDMLDTNQPTLFLGDFNLTPHSTDWRTIKRAGLQDAYQLEGVGFGMTWSDTIPLLRIDYIFASDHFSVREAGVYRPETTSDHRPVMATLTLYP